MAKDGNYSDADVIAKAYFTDGTYKKVTVKNDNVYGVGKDAKSKTWNTWFSYSEKKSGKYELTGVDGDDFKFVTVTGTLTENGKTSVGISGTKTGAAFAANKGTTFIVLDDDTVKVYEGIAKVPTIETNKDVKELTAYAKMDGKFAEYVFIDATDAHTKGGSKSNSDLIYLLDFDRAGTDADDNTYYQYNAIVNGEETKIKLDDSFGKKEAVMTLYDDVAYDSETGYVTDMSAVTADDKTIDDGDYKGAAISGEKIEFSKGVVSFVKDFALADNYNIYFVVDAGVKDINDNDDDYSVDTVTGSGLESECKDHSVSGSYVGVLNDDDEITDLYVYIESATCLHK